MTTADAAPAASGSSGSSSVRRVAWASMVGTSLESFDFYVFAYFSAFFVGPLFFEPLGEFGGTLLAFSTVALAFVVRPIGAVIFGHMGDRLGRRATLLWTIGIMGVATGLIGVLPTYAQAGWFGAVFLVILRIAQGLSLGGEWGGSILLATEHANPVKRAFYAAVPQLGSPVGSILSAALFIVMTLVLPTDQLVE
ncbi:MFS transporter, partial [Microbacterium sp.]|uniref:MFS transporter n=1 Tax=Microbacterium sp. TaxID=51671 RepID=UPI002D7676B6